MPLSLDDLHWPRHTARLTLRRAGAEDLPQVFSYRSDPRVSRWLAAEPGSIEDLAKGFGSSALVALRHGQIIGDLQVRVCNAWSQAEVADQARGTQAELSWCLAPEHQGQGYGTESVRELISIAFELGVRRIEAGCFAENAASRRLMQKVGLRQEGYYVQDALHRDSSWRDGVSYALLAEEWSTLQ